jgi:cell fate regulator YaaT (PSP1 superfamily)
MVTVAGVRFKKAGKIYYFDPAGLPVECGTNVIVETARGMEFGTVISGIKDVPESEIIPPLKKIIRIANENDIVQHQENINKKQRALMLCQEKVDKHNLEMKLIDVEYTFDNSKIIFYFTADGRVDFRELVKDLAAIFKMRIELRQIGVRDEAKMVGGIGNCGKGLCCHTWLPEFEPVSIKMAKVQNLSLNPTKISGICGRLMCCLKYENEIYYELRKGMPEVGERIKTID